MFTHPATVSRAARVRLAVRAAMPSQDIDESIWVCDIVGFARHRFADRFGEQRIGFSQTAAEQPSASSVIRSCIIHLLVSYG